MRVLVHEPVIVVGQLAILIGDADDLLICLAPALACPADLNFYYLGGILLNLRELELLEKLAHDKR